MLTRNVTIADVARKAGVSKAAAWSVLSGKKSTIGLAGETRGRVRQAADELGYLPDLTARALSTKRSLLIGLFLRDPYRQLFVELLQGVQSVCDELDYSVVSHALGSSTEDQIRQLRRLTARRMDAAIVIPSFDPSGRTSFPEIQRMGVPVVQLLGRVFPGVPASTIDFQLAGKLATRHLIDLGHRRIVHVTRAGYRDEERPGFYRILRDRWEGYETAMREAKLEPQVIVVEEQAAGFDSAKVMAQLQAQGATGVVSLNDWVAWPLIVHGLDKGVCVPGDWSVTGCDDDPVRVVGGPALTTVRFPVFELGAAAARMALEMIEGKEVQEAVFAPELVVRQSTAPVG